MPVRQEGDLVWFERRSPSQSELPDAKDINKLYDFIRMLDAPTYPAAYVDYRGWRLSFSDASLTKSHLEARVTIRKIEEKDYND